MPTVSVPLSITYKTDENTPIPDVIAALQAADVAITDAVSLLPSLIDGLHIEHQRISVRALTQESPLRELFLVTLLVAFQDDLKSEVPPMIESLLGADIPDNYDSIVTVMTMTVVFYGAAFVKDALSRSVEDHALRNQVNALVDNLAARTGKTPDEVRAVLDAKYGKPSTMKRLTRSVSGFFRPVQREGAKPVVFDREVVPQETVAAVPYLPDEGGPDLERYASHSGITLHVHAQDRDRAKKGWAAVPDGLHDKRLRMKLVEPVTANDLWQRNVVNGDIVLVSKATSDGYVPVEIQLTRINPD